MNFENHKQLEEKLRQLRPIPVDPEMKARIDQALRASGRARLRSKVRSVASWSSLAIAASLLLTFGIFLFNGRLSLSPENGSRQPANSSQTAQPTAETVSREDDFHPVLAENTFKNRVDEGIVFLRNGLTARRYRYEFVDRVVWKNPSDGAVMEMEVPRDEVILVPVQTF